MYWSRSQLARGLRRRSTAACLLRLWVRIPPGAWMFVCCVLSGRGLCDVLITRPEEYYRLWRVVVCDQETSKTRRLKPATGLWKIQPQWVVTAGKQRQYLLVVWIGVLVLVYYVRRLDWCVLRHCTFNFGIACAVQSAYIQTGSRF